MSNPSIPPAITQNADIFSLPNETLAEIFSLTLDAVQDGAEYPFDMVSLTAARGALQCVCHHWAAVAYATPELWRTIVVYAGEDDVLSTFADARCGAVPVDLKIVCCRARLTEDESLAFNEDLHKVLPRLRTFSVDQSSLRPRTALAIPHDVGGVLPNLRRLDIRNAPDACNRDLSRLLLAAPNVQDVAVPTIHPLISLLDERRSSLQHLHHLHLNAVWALQSSYLSILLANVSQLETLHIGHPRGHAAAPALPATQNIVASKVATVVKLERLRNVFVGGPEHLALFTAPNLRYLAVEGGYRLDDEPGEAALSFFNASKCPLETLEFSWAAFDISVLNTVIAMHPTLTSVAADNFDAGTVEALGKLHRLEYVFLEFGMYDDEDWDCSARFWPALKKVLRERLSRGVQVHKETWDLRVTAEREREETAHWDFGGIEGLFDEDTRVCIAELVKAHRWEFTCELDMQCSEGGCERVERLIGGDIQNVGQMCSGH